MAQERTPKAAQAFAAMVQSAASVVLSSLSTSSHKAYNKNIQHFIMYIKSLPVVLKCFPATVGHIVLYISHLHGANLAYRTILNKLSSLSYWHKAYGQPDPADHFLVKRALLGVRKAGPTKSAREPLMVDTLKFMLENGLVLL